jgi:hypothetical protein
MPSFADVALPGILVTSALGALAICLVLLRYGLGPPADDPRELLLMRVAHAAAGTCFALSAMLALVVLADRARPASTPPAVEALGVRLDAVLRDLAALRARSEGIEALVSGVHETPARLTVVERRIDRRIDRLEPRLEALDREARRLSADVARALAAVDPSRRSTTPAAAPRPTASLPTRGDPQGRPPLRAPASRPPVAGPTVGPDLPPSTAAAPAPVSPALAGSPEPAVVRPATSVAPPPADGEPRSGVGEFFRKLRGDWKVIKRSAGFAGEEIRDALERAGRPAPVLEGPE